jgi:long-chain acyl-CoA synthetase
MLLTRIQETASRCPDKIAVQTKAGTEYKKYTYRDLISIIASLSRGLSRQGVAKGDRVAVFSENRPEWIFSYLGIAAMGAVVVPLDAQLTEKEVSVLLDSSGATAVFVSAACRQKLPPGAPLTIISFDPGDGVLFNDLISPHGDAALPPAPPPTELAAILYTSGTTGDPKGVMLTHGNLASNLDSVVRLNLVDRTDNLLLILPLHHTYPAMACMLLPLSIGAVITILNSLKGPDILACMREAGVTVMLGVPQLFAALRRAIFDEIGKKLAPVRLIVKLLLALNGTLRKALNVNIGRKLFHQVHERFGPQLRLFASGGARLDPDVYTDLNRLGFTVIEGYGLTETSPVCTFNPLEKQKAGSIGIPIPGVEVRIANPDETGQGEITVRGPNVMAGYYKKPEATAEAVRDGWFYTGDLGYRDRDGYFFITGRSKEMIVLSTGKKIFPDELEKFYKQIPSIKDLCLIQGERGIEAAVVPNFDYLRKMNIANARETIAFEIEDLGKDLPPYKRIMGLKMFKDPLPVTRLGKLKRSVVLGLYLKGGEPAEKVPLDEDAGLLESPAGKKVVACLAHYAPKKKIVSSDNLELDLGLDSLARVELVVSLDQTFGVKLPDSFGSEVFTVKDVILKVQEFLAAVPVEGKESIRLSWTEILGQEPAEDVKRSLQIESGPLCNAGKYLIRTVLKLILKVYGRISSSGVENLPPKGPYIIAPNHLSNADAPAVMSAMPWSIGSQTFFLGITKFFGGPITSRIAKVIQVIPVDMDAKLYSALRLSAFVLRQGKVLLVFPEGSRSRDGTIKEFKKGVGIIAKELNVPIVPVAIRGTYDMLRPGRYFPRPARVSVSFGKTVSPGDRDYDEIVKDLYEKVVKMLEGHEREMEGE